MWSISLLIRPLLVQAAYLFFRTSSRPALVRSLPSIARLKSSSISGGIGFEVTEGFDFEIAPGNNDFEILFGDLSADAVLGERIVFVPWRTCNGTRPGGGMVDVV